MLPERGRCRERLNTCIPGKCKADAAPYPHFTSFTEFLQDALDNVKHFKSYRPDGNAMEGVQAC